MSDNFEMYAADYADAAGLKPTDMPSSHHPLLESNEEIRELSDLIDARRELTPEDELARDLGADDPNFDIQDALTLPHKGRATTSADRTPPLPGWEGSAGDRTDEDDTAYMTRSDFEKSMEENDPDPNVGAGQQEALGNSGIDRAPDITGTVSGIARGTATHVSLDAGADGFQIRDGDALDATLLDDDMAETADADGGILLVTPPNINTRDDALDAVRQLR